MIDDEKNNEKEESKALSAAESESTSEESASGFEGGTRIIRLKNGKEVTVPVESRRFLAADIALSMVMTVLAGIIYGFGVYYFVRPNDFAVGGISGVAIILERLVPSVNQGYWMMMFNAPLLVLAWIFLSRRYFFMTLGYIFSYSLTTIVTEKIDAALGGILSYVDPQMAILAAACGGIFGGVSLTLMIRIGGSQGGTSVIAAIVNKKRPDMTISWVTFALDAAVILCSVFVYPGGITPILLAIIEAFAASAVSDVLLKGAKSGLKAEIVTKHCDEISAEIFERLDRGVTVFDSVGQYTGEESKTLNCVIRRRQLGELRRIIQKYPDTFAYIVPASEVYGYWQK